MAIRVDERPGPAHIAIALILLALQFFLMLGMTYALSHVALDAMDCGAAACGDIRWAWRGVLTSLIGGSVVLLLSAAVVAWRLVKGRRSVGAAVTGCVLQVFSGLFAMMVVGLA